MALKNPLLQRVVDDLKAKLPEGEKREFFERIMVGGLKIMFDDASLVDERIQAGDDVEHGIGQGVVDLIGLIFERSRRTMPWDVGTIAGYALVAEVLDYAEQKGIVKVDNDVVGRAMQIYAETLLEKTVGKDKLNEMMNDPRVKGRLAEGVTQ